MPASPKLPSVRRPALVLTLVASPLAVLEVLRRPSEEGLFGPSSTATGVVLTLLATLPLAALDVRPRSAIALSGVAFVVATLAGQWTNLAAVALLIAVGPCAFVGGRDAAVLAVLTGASALVLAPALTAEPIGASNALSNLLVTALCALGGLSARVQRSYAAQLEARAEELEAMRETETQRAIAEERLRIARDVHDVVGHALAAIALHARVATRRLSRDPPGAAGALADIAELAASALADTRDAVGQLRTSDRADLRPRRGLEDLDELVAALRASDLPVTLRREGGGQPVPTAVQAAAYRIVQESLSNVARHARPATAAVVVRREPSAVLIEVSDDGRGGDGPVREGHGLTGMRERAASLGGTLEAGPRPTGGWTVRATLPVAT